MKLLLVVSILCHHTQLTSNAATNLILCMYHTVLCHTCRRKQEKGRHMIQLEPRITLHPQLSPRHMQVCPMGFNPLFAQDTHHVHVPHRQPPPHSPEGTSHTALVTTCIQRLLGHGQLQRPPLFQGHFGHVPAKCGPTMHTSIKRPSLFKHHLFLAQMCRFHSTCIISLHM